MNVRTLLVQADTQTRSELRDIVGRNPRFELLDDCSNGEDGLNAVLSEEPDLLFVDARLPDVSGFELFESISRTRTPTAVFTSDRPRDAMRAFDVGAADYLLRPLDRDRLAKTLERVQPKSDSAASDIRSRFAELLESTRPSRRNAHLVVKSPRRGFVILKTDEIDWIDAARSYVKINCGGKVTKVRETMQAMEEHLDGERFLRIHRSTVVNVERIREVLIREHGDYSVLLDGGQALNLGRSYRGRLLDRLSEISDFVPPALAS